MSWIASIQPAQADENLRKHYRRVVGTQQRVDNVLSVHALRPQILLAHMGLYKAVMHHSDLRLPLWLREAMAVYVSRLNRCDYCVAHHRHGLRAALADDQRFAAIDAALARPQPGSLLPAREQAIFAYVRKLTVFPADVAEDDIQRLREHGCDDGEILEINQVVAYFCYVNRVVTGLGVELETAAETVSGQSDSDLS